MGVMTSKVGPPGVTNIDELLRLDAVQLRTDENWRLMDKIVCALPSNAEKIRAWEQICVTLD